MNKHGVQELAPAATASRRTPKVNMTLNWETSYAIALELRRQHPDVNIEKVTLKQIYDWTLQLQEFEDEPSLANDEILYAIYQEWFEET